ncbi:MULTISPECIES: class I SAM-dependent DNA methyltransferase [Mannheimia]|uniref:site-specific DNA-methyltransferase (adenine-specific) n=1 Tax=Mannheimia pernigra TaxID=111844 RepID=A0ABD7A5Q2_9PAST|nr:MULTISPECIES: N-6 DNA methylase [Mannheimia]QLB41460.1 N-6 DNA methylase [Mannheimia pernigra]QTM01300.1 N-6 DNA methylase [Mannheimia sp. ZY171111]
MKSKHSETETEWLFKDLLNENGYLGDDDLIVEFKDKTKNEKVKKLLSNASKKGNRNGIPDFIIRSHKYPDIIFLIECKPDIRFHESKNRDKYAGYAVDGVLLYSSFVSKEFDVLSIAISGTPSDYKVDAFWQLRGTDNVNHVDADKLLPYKNYLRLILESDEAFRRDYNTLLSYAKTLNADLHKKKIKESNRALLISGVLVALQNNVFRISYQENKTSKDLITALLNAISSELRSDELKNKNADTVLGAFNFIRSNKTFEDKKTGLANLLSVINSIKDNVYTFLDKYKYIDTLSQFYIEFLRYANTDKGLGIVLTPLHIAQLFAKMAGVNKDTVVLDNAAGTGGFLVAAMGEMILDAGDDEQKILDIKRNQIYGIEYEDSILALLVSNMIIHSDGRSNIYWGSSFDIIPHKLLTHKDNNKEKNEESRKIPKRYEDIDLDKNKIDIGLLNPPFKMATDDIEEFDFIFSNLNAVKKGGKVIALVPASVINDTTGINYINKKKLLDNHTLEAVVSLPEDLFANSKTSIVTVGVVITAHIPHSKLKETWFGYWRDDKFAKTKNLGRADINNEWYGENKLQEQWLSSFINQKEDSQFSVKRKVTADNEWLAEAYLKTNYNSLTIDTVLKPCYQYMAFRIENGNIGDEQEIIEIINNVTCLHSKLNVKHQKRLDEVFNMHNGVISSNVEVQEDKISNDYLPYVRPSKRQSTSYAGFVESKAVRDEKKFPAGTLYVSTDGAGSHTYAYVSIEEFIPNSNVVVLEPKLDMNLETKLLYAAYITANRFKFSYGRKPKGERLGELLLPII